MLDRWSTHEAAAGPAREHVRSRLSVGVAAVLSTVAGLALLSPCSADVNAPRCLGRPATVGVDRTCGEPACPVNRKYVGTRVAERRVNNMKAQQTTPACFAEADFMLTADDHLVATHDPAMGGTCGDVGQQTLDGVRRCRLAGGTRVATLEDFLSVPLTEWYIDLKSNLVAGSAAEILHSVEIAVHAITAQRRKRGAILFLYQVTPEAADLIRRHGIRAGMKGYPTSRPAAEGLVDAAKANGFEAICIRITYVDRRMLDYSLDRGVWHLTWELNEKTPAQWRRLADLGLTGLLTTRARLQRAERAIGGRPPGWVADPR